MPVKTGKDSKGCFAQWGSQKKYYYACGDKSGRNRAKQKAHIQGAAITKQTGGEEITMAKKKTFEGHLIRTEEFKDVREENPFADVDEAGIDAETRMIKNVCVFGTRHSKNGYTYLDPAITKLASLAEGAKWFVNHPSKSEAKDRDGVRDMKDWGGIFANAHQIGDKVFADLMVREAFWPLAQDVAIMKPVGIGNSINSRVKVFKDANGKENVLDIDVLKSIDLVAAAATTTSLFESYPEDDELDDELDEMDMIKRLTNLLITNPKDGQEGLLKDRIKDRKISQAVNRIQWDAGEVIDEILREKGKKFADKKAQIASVLDDLEGEINKILSGKSDLIKENDLIEEDDEMKIDEITIADLAKGNPALIAAIKAEADGDEKVKKLAEDFEAMKAKLDELTKAHDDLKAANEELSKERDALKLKVDEFETNTKASKKESFIGEKIEELKLPAEAISDFFKKTLMGMTDDEITEALTDRKDAWFKGSGNVKNLGDDHTGDDVDRGKGKVSEEKMEAARKKMIDTIGG